MVTGKKKKKGSFAKNSPMT